VPHFSRLLREVGYDEIYTLVIFFRVISEEDLSTTYLRERRLLLEAGRALRLFCNVHLLSASHPANLDPRSIG
jgi:hypothetical protein